MKALVIGNWKMNPGTMREAKKLLAATVKAAKDAKKVSVVIAPPALFLRELKAAYRGRSLAFAAQTAHWADGGAHTGELSMTQVKDAGTSYVILGHSERRASGETDDMIRQKVAAALAHRLTPILCVGELTRGKDAAYLEVVRTQIRIGLSDVPPEKVSGVIVAYEPVWAIGGEQSLQPSQMHEMAIFIRKSVVSLKGQSGMKVRVIYGGSVNEDNAAPMLHEGDVVGLLPGHVSVDAERFTALLNSLS